MEYANAKSMEYVIIMKRYIDKYCDMVFDMIINLKQYVGDWGKKFWNLGKEKEEEWENDGKVVSLYAILEVTFTLLLLSLLLLSIHTFTFYSGTYIRNTIRNWPGVN